MPFYYYSQNNSGGKFRVDENLANYLYVEADSAEAADRKASGFGVYFDGYGDCECCGRRWSEASETSDYSRSDTLEDLVKRLKETLRWGFDKGKEENEWNSCRVHLRDGRCLRGSVTQVIEMLLKY